MVRLRFSLGVLAGVTLLAAVAADPPARTEKKAPNNGKDVRVAFERLKKLVGDWQQANPKDEADRGKVTVRYRLTAGGSAVVETLFPGDDKEMLTVYHRDGNDLLLTHYCCCGNQPRMRARVGRDTNELVFDFDGGSNLDPARDPHMHNYRVRFVDADHLHGEWEFYQDGKSASKHTFDLVRKK
jgi:hypothetical protein